MRYLLVGRTRLRRKRTLPTAAQFPYHLSTQRNANPLPAGAQYPTLFPTGDFTIQLLIKWQGHPPTSPFGESTFGGGWLYSDTTQVVVLASASPAGSGYSFLLKIDHGKLYLQNYAAGNSAYCPEPVPLNRWFCLTVAVSYATSTVRFYFDKTEVASVFYPYRYADTFSYELASYSAQTLLQFFGYVAEPRLYEVALTPSQVFDTYRKKVATLPADLVPSLVSACSFATLVVGTDGSIRHHFPDLTGRYFTGLVAYQGSYANALVGCDWPLYPRQAPGPLLVAS